VESLNVQISLIAAKSLNCNKYPPGMPTSLSYMSHKLIYSVYLKDIGRHQQSKHAYFPLYYRRATAGSMDGVNVAFNAAAQTI